MCQTRKQGEVSAANSWMIRSRILIADGAEAIFTHIGCGVLLILGRTPCSTCFVDRRSHIEDFVKRTDQMHAPNHEHGDFTFNCSAIATHRCDNVLDARDDFNACSWIPRFPGLTTLVLHLETLQRSEIDVCIVKA